MRSRARRSSPLALRDAGIRSRGQGHARCRVDRAGGSAMTRHDRVRQSTSPSVNRAIRETTEQRIAALRRDPQQINARLQQVDAEWDVERALETLSSTVSLV